MAIKYVSQKAVKGKTVLVRVDVNSEIVSGKPLNSERIKASAETIKLFKKWGAKVVVIAHQGRPGGKDFTSLKEHAKLINKITRIEFVPDIIGKRAQEKIKDLKNDEAILLENVRMLKDEFKTGKTPLVKILSSLCDIYVNDAFSVSHRVQATITEFPKIMVSFGGPLLEKEVKALEKVSLKNCLYILAGAKPADNMKLMKKNKILAGGLFGQMCLITKGIKFGEQEKFLRGKITNYEKTLNELKKKMKSKGKLVETSVDYAIEVNGKRKEISIGELPSKYSIFDIGKKTQEKYMREIKKAKSIYMKGPVGYYPDKKFREGTTAIIRAISNSHAFSLLGGGDLSEAIKFSEIPKNKFNHVSLSGGALLDYIAGKKLPGLKSLGFYNN